MKKILRSVKRAMPALFIMIVMMQSGCLYFKNHPGGVSPLAKESGNFQYDILGEAEGISSSFTMLWVLPVTNTINYDEAVTDAIRSKGGDNLIDITSWREKNVYIVGTVDVLHVKGTVVRYIRTQ